MFKSIELSLVVELKCVDNIILNAYIKRLF